MGWEQRGSGRYYFRKVRRGGRVVSMYAGAGEDGRRAEAADQQQRAERQAARAARKAERDALDAAERAMAAWWRTVELLADVSLLAAGYHQHNQGAWRKVKT